MHSCHIKLMLSCRIWFKWIMHFMDANNILLVVFLFPMCHHWRKAIKVMPWSHLQKENTFSFQSGLNPCFQDSLSWVSFQHCQLFISRKTPLAFLRLNANSETFALGPVLGNCKNLNAFGICSFTLQLISTRGIWPLALLKGNSEITERKIGNRIMGKLTCPGTWKVNSRFPQ